VPAGHAQECPALLGQHRGERRRCDSSGWRFSLSIPLKEEKTAFDITFTLLRPGILHLTVYDMDSQDKNDSAFSGIYLGDVVFKH
jgi:hypothetical protein